MEDDEDAEAKDFVGRKFRKWMCAVRRVALLVGMGMGVRIKLKLNGEGED